MSEATSDTHHRAVELLSAHVEPARTVSTLSATRSTVLLATGESGRKYVVKLYRGKQSAAFGGAEFERVAYSYLAGKSAVRRCVASGEGFVITDYVPGDVLMAAIRSEGFDCARAAQQVVGYMRACAEVAGTGFGIPDGRNLRGQVPGWRRYLDRYLSALQERLDSLPGKTASSLRLSYETLHRYLTASGQQLDDVPSALVPVDLNLANLLVTDRGRLVVLDLKTFLLADPLLALGEWTAHTYGTPMFGAVLTAWLAAPGARRTFSAIELRFYALLATLDIQLYIAGAGGDPDVTCPWGNDVCFGELAGAHRRALGGPGVTPEDLIGAVTALGSGWTGKPADGSRRGAADELLERLSRVQRLAGITRVADLTGLDRTGIHVSQCTRPEAEVGQDTFTVFSGRGRTVEQSRLGAVAEGIERFCGERAQFGQGRVMTGTTREIADACRVAGPEEFNLPADAGYYEDSVLEWIPATDIVSGEEYSVPACAVFYPYSPPAGIAVPMKYFTTGFGAGICQADAVTHGLAEVAERDAAALNRILRASPAVDLGSVRVPAIREQLDRLLDAGLEVIVRWITAPDIGIPAFSAICDDIRSEDTLYISGGYGAHPDKNVALLRALEEAAASRAGTISGAREDLAKFRARTAGGRAAFRSRYAYWFDLSGTVDFAALHGDRLPTVLDDLAAMTGAFRLAGFTRVLVVDLSRDEFGLRVVKVLVPGAERYSFSMRCVGRRARTMYRERYGRELNLPPLHAGFRRGAT